jgi:hypothetical protein
MKKGAWIVSILVLTSLTVVKFTAALVINDYLMTVETPSLDCSPPTPTYSFSLDDGSAYSWLLYSGFTAGDRIDWEFYDPDNTLYDTYAFVPPPFSPAEGCVWGSITIAPLDPPTGNWHVDIYVNNVYKLSQSFTIARKGLCPLKALYDSESQEIELLRLFRDTVLIKTQQGRELKGLYYQWSPFIVKAMEEDEAFQEKLEEFVKEIMPLVEKVLE